MRLLHVRRRSTSRRPAFRPSLDECESRQLLSVPGGSIPATGFFRPIFDEAGFKHVRTHVRAFISRAVQANGVADLKTEPSHHHQNAIVGLSTSGVRATYRVIAHAVARPVAAGVTPALSPVTGRFPIVSLDGPPYWPDQIKQAYGFDQVSFTRSFYYRGHRFYYNIPGDGSGETIAIVDAYDDPTIFRDADTFDRLYAVSQYNSSSLYNAYGPSSSWLTKVTPEGTPAVSSGWSSEIALDVEWAHAIAPGAKIMLIEAKSPYDSDMFGAVDYARKQPGVSVVSMSWDRPEFLGETSDDGYFTSQNGQGITFIASSGDSPGVQYPSASPNVLAIGGTSLSLIVNSYNGESIWASTGGGVSADEPAPIYQGYLGGSMGWKRAVPDAAYDADPNTGFWVYDTTGGNGWYADGGTSAGAPQWSAIIAIANQGRALYGLPTLNGPSQTLPLLYSASSLDFNDITSGSNKGYSAGPGYDMVTGLGSPKADFVVYSLIGQNFYLSNGVLTVNGDQLGANYNDEVVLSLTSSGGEQV
ncbi:MAG TPA: S53 family peptidase, partial [Isosphaeraceae bacterium]|nr:S53 family peptidase [Isosphaeraceae bacterium]